MSNDVIGIPVIVVHWYRVVMGEIMPSAVNGCLDIV